MEIKKQNIAFTLAEVLITLGIIGVVAALTIPVLMKNTNDLELKTQYKKELSSISQAVKMMAADSSGTIKGIYSTRDEFMTDLNNKLRTNKYCNDSGIEGCWFNNTSNNPDYRIYSYNNVQQSGFETSMHNAGIITNDGMLITYNGNYYSQCSQPLGDNGNICGRIWIDINGFKKPNTIGKDIYYIMIKENNATPFISTLDDCGGNQDTAWCFGANTGCTCGGKWLLGN